MGNRLTPVQVVPLLGYWSFSKHVCVCVKGWEGGGGHQWCRNIENATLKTIKHEGSIGAWNPLPPFNFLTGGPRAFLTKLLFYLCHNVNLQHIWVFYTTNPLMQPLSLQYVIGFPSLDVKNIQKVPWFFEAKSMVGMGVAFCVMSCPLPLLTRG